MRSHEEGPPDGSRDRLRGERYELCARGADGSGTWANARSSFAEFKRRPICRPWNPRRGNYSLGPSARRWMEHLPGGSGETMQNIFELGIFPSYQAEEEVFHREIMKCLLLY